MIINDFERSSILSPQDALVRIVAPCEHRSSWHRGYERFYSPDIAAARWQVERFVLHQTALVASLACFRERTEIWRGMPNGYIEIEVVHQRGTSCHYTGTNRIKIKVAKEFRALRLPDRAQIAETVLHEACHIYAPGEHHGPGFRSLLCSAAREAYGIEIDPDERGTQKRRNRAYELDDIIVGRLIAANPTDLGLNPSWFVNAGIASTEGGAW